MTTVCPECGAHLLAETEHCCPPWFTVWCRDARGDHGDGERVRALTLRSAAVRWAELYGQNSQHIPAVRVTRDSDGHTKWFEITGEVAMNYHASETEEPTTWTTLPPPTLLRRK